MRIAITGTPGVGKTSVSKALGKFYKCKVFNEKEFALKEGIGVFDTTENELVVPLKKLEKHLNKTLEKEKNIIFEGHLLCEIKANFDLVILIKCDPELLELRLDEKGYKAEKIQDNVFCEGIEYCLKHAKRNYEAERLIVVESRKSIKETTSAIITEIQKKGTK